MGKVPAFKDSDGNELTESIAIMIYFARVSDNHKSLAGIGELEEANVIRWSSFFNQDFRGNGISPMVGALTSGKPELEEASQNLLSYFDYLDNHLAFSKCFASNDNLTCVNISVCVFFKVIFSQLPEETIQLENYGNIYRWYFMLLQHPVVLKTFR